MATRDRIVTASAELFRRQGYPGTGVKEIVAAARAPFGSVYHFFPGGKEELGAEAIRVSGGLYGELIDRFFADAPDVAAATEAFFAGAAQTLHETDFADACPIATVALEVASTNETLRVATAEVFEDWIARTAASFAGAGVADASARTLATAVLALLEGAFVLCRATRSTRPLDAAGVQAGAAVRAALEA